MIGLFGFGTLAALASWQDSTELSFLFGVLMSICFVQMIEIVP